MPAATAPATAAAVVAARFGPPRYFARLSHNIPHPLRACSAYVHACADGVWRNGGTSEWRCAALCRWDGGGWVVGGCGKNKL